MLAVVAVAATVQAPWAASRRSPKPKREPVVWSGKVVGVTDGDTVAVLRDGKDKVTIRLQGIDAPERSQAFGTRSKQHASDLCFGKDVQVRDEGHDRYGRTLGWLKLPDGRDVAHEMVRAGMAWWYRYFARNEKELEDLEAAARAGRVGLWADAAPEAPWDYRRRASAARKKH